MKIGLISNTAIGLHLAGWLNMQKALAATACPAVNHPANQQLAYWCEQSGTPFIHFSKKNILDELTEWIRSNKIDWIWIAGCPYKIPEEICAELGHKVLNFHPGKLPLYRGADPVFWQVRNGETNLTFSVHKVNKEIDAGDLLLEYPIKRKPHYTYGFTWVNFVNETAAIAQQVWQKMQSLTPVFTPQQVPGNEVFWRKPGQQDLIIDWNTMTNHQVANLVLACNPVYDAAYALIRQGQIQFLRVHALDASYKGKPGEILKADAEGFLVQAANGKPIEVQIAKAVEGILPGSDIYELGLTPGECFDSLQTN